MRTSSPSDRSLWLIGSSGKVLGARANPARWLPVPQRHPVTTLDALPAGTGKAFLVAGRKIAIFNAGGRLFAIGDECTHVGASLAEGTLDGTIVACPWR